MDEMANRFSEAWNKALEPIIEKTIHPSSRRLVMRLDEKSNRAE